MDDPKNIILLTIDALRSDHLSCYGYDRKTSPFLDHLSNDNVQFLNAFSASSHTREAVPSLLTGQHPDIFSDNEYRLVEDSIATYLKETPLKTGAFHSNPFVSRAYNFDKDFDKFDDDLYLGQNKLIALAQRAWDKLRHRNYARAETINKRSLKWIDSLGDQPFFLWNHYMDVHGPYEPPESYRKEFHGNSISSKKSQELYDKCVDNPELVTEKEEQTQVDLYDSEISYVDSKIKSMMNEIDSRGLLKNSLVIISADHGDAFGEHGYYGHPRRLDDILLSVPLILIGPDLSKAEITQPVSTLDIIPTILEECGQKFSDLPGEPLNRICDEPSNFTNRIIISQARGENSDRDIRRYCARDESNKYSLSVNISTGDMNVTSPNDNNNHLKSKLIEFCTNRDKTSFEESSIPSSESEKQLEDRLEALGYK